MTRTRSFSGDEARLLLRRTPTGTLATINRDGGIPYASLINLATDIEGQPLILVSSLAWHTKNLQDDRRASVLVAEPPETGDILTGSRVTIMGRFEKIDAPRVVRRYLARHPEAAIYAGFGDFGYWRLVPETIHAVAGFGRIETLAPTEVFPAVEGFAGLEESAIEHMNHDHPDAIRRYVSRLGGDPAANWPVQAIDPDGADLSDGTQTLRLPFPAPATDANTLRQTLAHLARVV
jgi:putative heme iron utilization protein